VRVGTNVSPELLDALRREGLDSVEGAFAYSGGQDLLKAGLGHRRRTRLKITDKTGREHELYLKRYEREGLWARLRRWWTYGLRTSPAGVEFDNIEALQAAGVPTMQAVICGQQWGCLDARRSYLIVTAVPGRKLEQCMAEFLDRNAENPEAIRGFTVALGRLVARLHAAGYVHRDLYSAHVFLDERHGSTELYLIDLARVFAPRFRRMRWWIKDLAQVKYSMPQRRWVEGYWGLFLREYLGRDGDWAAQAVNRRIDRKVALMRFRRRRAGGEVGR